MWVSSFFLIADPSFFDADSSGSAGKDSSGNPVPLSEDIRWDNLMSYISHLHSIIDYKVSSNIISERAGRCMKGIIESVRSGTRLNSEMVKYLTEDIEGYKIGRQMKFFGEGELAGSYCFKNVCFCEVV